MPLFKTLLRSASSSLAGVAVEFGLLTLLVSVLKVFYLAGAALSSVACMLVGFVLTRHWAFKATAAPPWRQLGKHVMVSAGGMLLGLCGMYLLVDGARLPYQLGWAIAGSVCFVSWTFPMQRFFVYPRRATLAAAVE